MDTQTQVETLAKRGAQIWQPQEGPQVMFHACLADECLYGGAAGGGKSESLLVESARYVHKPGYHAILFRRTFPELVRADGLIPRSKQLFTGSAEWREGEKRWYFQTENPNDPATIDFSHLEHLDDIYAHQSAAYAYIGFDELTSFLEEQYLYLVSRGRSTRGIPIRYRGATNPGNEGHAWVMSRWAAWLDPTHINPAQFGELRYYARIQGTDTEVEIDWTGPNGERPMSRTFIQAFLEDNPALMLKDPQYRFRLESLPEPYRSQLRQGNWLVGKEDEWQVIPYTWIRAAMDRWSEKEGDFFEPSGFSCDPARGIDNAVIAKAHGPWVAPLYYRREKDTMYLVGELGKLAAGTGLPVKIDVIGVGAGVYDRARELNTEHAEDPDRIVHIYPINSSEKVQYSDSSGQLVFVNLRAYMWWHMRELLDPSNPLKIPEPIMLPPDKILLADLASPRWRMTSSGIIMESKIDIKKRIGRSTDAGDSVVMLFHDVGSAGSGLGGIWI